MKRRSFLGASLAFGLSPSLPAAPASHLGFAEIARAAGVNFRHQAARTSRKYLPEAMGAGVALFDFNGDGYLDLFYVNGAGLTEQMSANSIPDKSDPRFWNRLYRNNKDGTFTDVTEAAGLKGRGYGMGVAVGDYNNDGHPDLYVTGVGANALYRNNGDGTFTDVTEAAGVAGNGWSVSACFVDYDRDGFLDLIVTRYLDWNLGVDIYCGEHRPGYRSYCHPNEFKPVTCLVFHNNGDGTFTDVSRHSGFEAAPGKALGLAINDFDGDGWPDIAVANDSFPQQLFRNNRDGTFAEVAVSLGLAYDEDGKTFAGMGIDFADYNNDGLPDIFINALASQRYALYNNEKGKAFNYVSGRSGIGAITANHSGWGARFFDYDNDGLKDLFVAQGHVMDNIELTNRFQRYLEPLLLLRNQGSKFGEVAGAFAGLYAGRGAAVGDLNNDGNLDLAVNCNDGPALLWKNRGGTGRHWLLVNTVGTRSNRDGIGSRIRIVSPSEAEQFGYVSTAGSYASASDKRVHFGLGGDSKVSILEVQWPSGLKQQFRDVPADQVFTVREQP